MSHAAAATIDPHNDPSTSTGIPNKKLLLWAFLASDCMFFGSLISTHLIYRLNPIEGNANATETFNIELTSFSTFILLMSSLMMALSVAAIQKGNVSSMRRCLLTTIFFGLIFLGCQVYEFNHFVFEKHLTLSSSLFGSTFFVLTGTHGTHVAIGVLWLMLMYVRSFQPADGNASRSWYVVNFLHVGIFVGAIITGMVAVLGGVHAFEEGGLSFATIGGFAGEHAAVLAALGAFLLCLRFLARSRGPVDFGEANAIDVESMGLYWHFVDIVWIVIFTAVYLMEYVPLN